jgi:hypothetical protein
MDDFAGLLPTIMLLKVYMLLWLTIAIQKLVISKATSAICCAGWISKGSHNLQIVVKMSTLRLPARRAFPFSLLFAPTALTKDIFFCFWPATPPKTAKIYRKWPAKQARMQAKKRMGMPYSLPRGASRRCTKCVIILLW